MKLIKTFNGIFLIILITLLLFFVLKYLCRINLTYSDFILFITFEALIYYTYFTYKIYRQDLILSASINLVSAEEPKKHYLVGTEFDNHIFWVKMQNFTKYSIKCWCVITPIIFDEKYEFKDFYGGYEFRIIQPFGTFNGWIDIQRMLGLAGENYKEIFDHKKNNFKDDEILKVNVDFKYSLLNGEELTKNPSLNYFYIFRQRSLSLY